MPSVHPLDYPAWSALTGRQSHLALVEGGARRYHPAYGVFAGLEDRSSASISALGRLVAAGGVLAFLEGEPPPLPAGAVVASAHLGVQMTAARLAPAPAPGFQMVPLSDADGPEMLALATLTRPGPFFERTHQLGDFVGVRVDGRLAAMAGERMKPDGFTEVSGVCTHPDHRGRGYAGALMRHVCARIRDRGETPFLHAYASNTAAIALYETLGFTLRREVWMVRLEPAAAPSAPRSFVGRAMHVHAVRLTPGSDLRSALEAFVRERAISAGCILTCVGSLSRLRLRMPGDAGSAERFLDLHEPVEIVSLTGTLGPDGAHLHMCAARGDGACVGGHLTAGCLVHTTAEVVIANLRNGLMIPDFSTRFAAIMTDCSCAKRGRPFRRRLWRGSLRVFAGPAVGC